MSESISAADANRQFSRMLRGVREDRATYIVTSHGRPVARLVPIDERDERPGSAALLRNEAQNVDSSDGEPRCASLPPGTRLSLEQLWERARALGAGHPSESSAIIRADRDARHRR